MSELLPALKARIEEVYGCLLEAQCELAELLPAAYRLVGRPLMAPPSGGIVEMLAAKFLDKPTAAAPPLPLSVASPPPLVFGKDAPAAPVAVAGPATGKKNRRKDVMASREALEDPTRRTFWTAEDDARLLASDAPLKALASLFGRSVVAVTLRRSKLRKKLGIAPAALLTAAPAAATPAPLPLLREAPAAIRTQLRQKSKAITKKKQEKATARKLPPVTAAYISTLPVNHPERQAYTRDGVAGWQEHKRKEAAND